MELGRFSVDRNGRSFAEFFSQDTLTKSTSKVGPGELSLISCLSLGLQPRPSQFIGSPSHPASTPFAAFIIIALDVLLSFKYQGKKNLIFFHPHVPQKTSKLGSGICTTLLVSVFTIRSESYPSSQIMTDLLPSPQYGA